MKIALTKASKLDISHSEMPVALQMIEEAKQNDDSVKEYAEMAARLISGGYVVKMLECSAEIAKNSRAWNDYTVNSGMLDVWVTFTAFTNKGFVIGGAYLTDIWKITGEEAYDKEIRQNMYGRLFTEK